MRFAEALSEEGDSRKALTDVCEEVAAAFEGDAPDLAFLCFTSHHSDRADMFVEEVRSGLGARHLIGCSGESLIGCGREVEGGPGVVLFAGVLPGVEMRGFRLQCEQTPDGFCFPLEPTGLLREIPATAGILLIGEPFSMPMDNYLRRFNEDHPGVGVVGGMASGGRGPGENVVMLDDAVHRDGAVGMVLTGDVSLRTVVSQGCRPVGRAYVVTDCDRNAILKLGGKPALGRVQELFASMSVEDRRLFQRAPHVGVVMNERQSSFGPGDFLIRNLVGVDPQKETVFISDYLRRGQTIQFHVRDGQAASDDLNALLEAERARYEDGGPRGGLIFSCNGRGTRLFDVENHDVSAVRDCMGEIPVSGFFAQGELGPVGDRNHLHGFTACVALFSGS
jgi:small ligand-binding sensory domain FIST